MLNVIITKDKIESLPPVIEGINGSGACVEFSGMIRPEEDGKIISGIEFEAYVEMAEKVILKKLDSLMKKYDLLGADVVHRYGKVAVGENAIRVSIWAKHRKEAYLANMEFMDELKKDVPIWKVATF
jgi:molybdopterin synthase catalytic subunit